MPGAMDHAPLRSQTAARLLMSMMAPRAAATGPRDPLRASGLPSPRSGPRPGAVPVRLAVTQCREQLDAVERQDPPPCHAHELQAGVMSRAGEPALLLRRWLPGRRGPASGAPWRWCARIRPLLGVTECSKSCCT